MSLWTKARRYHYGEFCLWALFVITALGALADSGNTETATTLAGISALAAIGVRATRAEPRQEPLGDQ